MCQNMTWILITNKNFGFYFSKMNYLYSKSIYRNNKIKILILILKSKK